MILGFLLRTEQWMPGLKSTLVAFRSGKALPFSTLGFVTPMQSLIKASPQNKSTASMRIRKKRTYASRVLEVAHGSFDPLVFTTTGGMANEFKTYLSTLV